MLEPDVVAGGRGPEATKMRNLSGSNVVMRSSGGEDNQAAVEAEILENVKDLALDMQRLSQLANCPELASMFAAAAAEARHQAQVRQG